MHSLPAMVRIGTRGSLLARWQANHIADRINRLGVATEIVLIQTTGDLDQRTSFGLIPDKGVFVKELEEALLARRIDLAVHSLKDLPTQLPEGLMLAAVPERESPLDALVCPAGLRLEELPAGARVASSSLRRQAQILALRPDLQVVPLRGNVPTRIEKVRRGEAEAALLAVAGLTRLELTEHITQVLPAETITPPMGQGSLGIEAREGEFEALWAALEDPRTRTAALAERRFLARVGGGCRTPVGILAEPMSEEGGWHLTAMLASPDGRQLMRGKLEVAAPADPIQAAEELAERMIAEAPPEIKDMLSRFGERERAMPEEQ